VPVKLAERKWPVCKRIPDPARRNVFGGAMMSRRFVSIALLLMSSLANSAVLECPANAPPAWKVGKARLDRARVLAFLPGDKLDEKALPDGPPDKEWRQGSILYQSWNVKAGVPPMIYQVDCVYAGTSRFLRFEANRVGECVAKWKMRGETPEPGTLEFRCR
jgi:hypothetical protein